MRNLRHSSFRRGSKIRFRHTIILCPRSLDPISYINTLYCILLLILCDSYLYVHEFLFYTVSILYIQEVLVTIYMEIGQNFLDIQFLILKVITTSPDFPCWIGQSLKFSFRKISLLGLFK